MSDQQPGVPDLAGMLGGLGEGGLGGLLAGAQQALAASQAAATVEVEGTAGGGVVAIRATAGGQFLGVRIDPSVVDPSDVEGLEDLVTAALRDLNTQIARVQAEAMGAFDPAAMLGGLFGGPDDESVIDADETAGDDSLGMG